MLAAKCPQLGTISTLGNSLFSSKILVGSFKNSVRAGLHMETQSVCQASLLVLSFLAEKLLLDSPLRSEPDSESLHSWLWLEQVN
jgi:hypothetical protein